MIIPLALRGMLLRVCMKGLVKMDKLYAAYTENNKIDPKYYDKFSVKRGLRNPDGSGVMAGVTNICNVHGYVLNEGEKFPDEGKLVFRGYNINDLVENVVAENRFGYP